VCGSRQKRSERWRGGFCYEAALHVRTERDFPVRWANTQINLAKAHAELAGEDLAHLEEAIAHIEAAVRGYKAAGLLEEAQQIEGTLDKLWPGKPDGRRAGRQF
jgi:hypothetical protein